MTGHGFSCPVCSNPYTIGDGGGLHVDLEALADSDAEALEQERRMKFILGCVVGGFLLVVFGLFIAGLGHAHGTGAGPGFSYDQGRTVLDLILFFK